MVYKLSVDHHVVLLSFCNFKCKWQQLIVYPGNKICVGIYSVWFVKTCQKFINSNKCKNMHVATDRAVKSMHAGCKIYTIA